MTREDKAIKDQIEDLINQLETLQQDLRKQGLDSRNDSKVLKLRRKLTAKFCALGKLHLPPKIN